MSKPFRSLLPASVDRSSSSERSPPYSIPTMPTKRKRQQVSVACSACQKRKSKCDAARPVCSLCQKKGTDCVYDVAKEMSRSEARKRDTEVVGEQNDRLRFVMDYLRFGSKQEADEVLKRLRSTEDLSETTKFIHESSVLLPSRFKGSSNHPPQQITSSREPTTREQMASPQQTSSLQAIGGLVETEPVLTQQLETLETFYEPAAKDPSPPIIFKKSSRGETWDYDESRNIRVKVPYITVSAKPWTGVTTDNSLVSHLLCIFFTWEHPFHGFIDQRAFVQSMRAYGDDTQLSELANLTFCSPLLVNAILAKACQCTCDIRDFLSEGDVAALGQRFYGEASKLLDFESEQPSITAMQAAWVMFTYESMQGKAISSSKSYQIVHRMYEQLGLAELHERPLDYDKNEEVRLRWDAIVVIIWGCYIRDSVDSLAGGWLPKIQRPQIETLQNHLDDKHQALAPRLWFPYPVLKVPVPCIQREMMMALADLTDIAHTVLGFVLPSLEKGSDEKPELEDAMRIYETLQTWQETLPENLQPEFGEVAHVYLLHVQFDAIVICLLRPFQEVDIEVSELERHPRSQCSAYATHAMSILWAYRARWGLVRCSSIPQGLMTVVFKLLFHLDSHTLSDKAFARACQGLFECSKVWNLTNLILLVIKSMAQMFHITLPDSCTEYFENLSAAGTTTEHDCDLRIPATIPSDFQDANRDPKFANQGSYDGHMINFLEYLKEQEQ